MKSSRRRFLRRAAIGTAALSFPAVLRAAAGRRDRPNLLFEILSSHMTATVCKSDEYCTATGEFDDGGMEVGDLVDVFDLKGRARCATFRRR